MNELESDVLKLLVQWARNKGFDYYKGTCKVCNGTGLDPSGRQLQCSNDRCRNGKQLVLHD